MPLISTPLPCEDGLQDEAVRKKDCEVREFDDDEYVDSDMEGSILNRPRPKKNTLQAPALPQRSEKRASKILDGLMKDLKDLERKEEDEREVEDPLESYLSSEEDASLSDEGSLSDFETEEDVAVESRAGSSRASRRESREDTARMVSFILAGKPQIVEIYLSSANSSPSRSTPRNLESLKLEAVLPTRSSSRPAPLILNTERRKSISSITSLAKTSTTTSYTPSASSYIPYSSPVTPTTSSTTLPPRKSSRLATNISSLVLNTRSSIQAAASASHAFLQSDPFANETSPYSSTSPEEVPLPKTPTGNGAAVANWKKGLSKSLAKARKPSMPKISLAYTAGVVTPRPSTSSRSSMATSQAPSEEGKEMAAETKSVDEKDEEVVVKEAPVRYEDIMKTAIRAPPPRPSSSMNSAAKKGFGMNLGRKKSVKNR